MEVMCATALGCTDVQWQDVGRDKGAGERGAGGRRSLVCRRGDSAYDARDHNLCNLRALHNRKRRRVLGGVFRIMFCYVNERY
jgi:hypothetical protein